MCKFSTGFSVLYRTVIEEVKSHYSHEEAFIYADANPYGILEIYSQKSRNQEICVMGV